MNKYISKNRLIYFLSALVIIIGCYALNLSYSMFVQTEESNLVDASVPNITYTLTPATYSIKPNSTEIVSLTLNSTTSVPFYYVLNTINSSDYSVKLYDEENNSISGTINSNETKTIKLAVINNTDSCKTVSFSLETEYTTIIYDISSHENNSNIDITNKYSGYGSGLANTILTAAKNNTTSGNTTYITTPITTPGVSISNSDEASFVPSEDDYGIIYYYRGNIIDNYVNFAGKCWKIVRTTGNGGVELVLEDGTTTCNSETFSGNFSIGTASFGYTQKNIDDTTNIYMVNLINSENIPSLYTSLIDYQTNGMNDYLNYLSENNWCYDDSAYTSTNITSLTNDKTTLYNNLTNFYYGSYLRNKDKQFSFKCSESATKISNINDSTKLYVGSLTLDEIIYSGLLLNMSNENSYLFNNIIKSWMTLSLARYSNTTTSHRDLYYIVNNNSTNKAYITTDYVSTLGKYNVRPVVVLNKDVFVTSGTGLKSSPYEIDLKTSCE